MIPLYEEEEATIINNLRKQFTSNSRKNELNTLTDAALYCKDAELYWYAANKLQNSAINNQFLVPSLFLMLYSFEISLKSLIMLSEQSTQKTHNLAELYNLLDSKHQRGIFKEFCCSFKLFYTDEKSQNKNLSNIEKQGLINQINKQVDELTFEIFNSKIKNYFGKVSYFVAIRYPNRNETEYILYSLLLKSLSSATKNYCADLINKVVR